MIFVMSVRRLTFKAWLLFILCLGTAGAAHASQCDSGDNSAKVFTQHFYDWYVPNVGKTTLPWSTALQHSAASFSSILLHALADDANAQAKATDSVGLDFDPFLDAQDPEDTYSIGNVIDANGVCRVQILGKTGTRPATLDVIAVVRMSSGGWQFQNFRYPDGGDLLTVLAQLKAGRDKAK